MAKTQQQLEQEEANKIVAAASKAPDKKKSNIDARQIAPAASTKKSKNPANVAGKRTTGTQANLAGGKRTTTKAKQADVTGTKANKSKKAKSGKDKDKSSDSDSNTGNTGAGIYFANRNAADIIRQLFDMFVLGKPQAANDDQQFKMMYDYLKEDNTSLNVKQIINLDVPSSDKEADYIKSQENDPSVPKIFNPDEAMQPRPMQFMAYQGSLASMIRDISNAPFNELYWTFGDAKTSDGTPVPEKTLSTLHIRQTPFEEEQWSNLPYTEVFPRDLISLSFDITDNDQYSIFDLTSNELANKPSERAQVPPITDDANELIARYGYKYYELQTWYFGLSSTAEIPGMSSSDLKAAQEDQVDQSQDTSAANFYPSLETFEAYFLVDKKDFDAKKVTDNMIDVPSRYGGNGLFEALKPILTNESKAYNSGPVMLKAAQDAATKYFKDYPDKSAENPVNTNTWTRVYNYLKNNKFALSKVAYISIMLPEWEHAVKDSQETQTTSNLYYALGKLGNVGDVTARGLSNRPQTIFTGSLMAVSGVLKPIN